MTTIKHLNINQSKLLRAHYTSKGHLVESSTVKKLAYNHAMKTEFKDEKIDYTKKQVDDFKEAVLILPKDTKTDKTSLELFTDLEDKYKKLGSNLAMNYIISLPQELDHESNKKIILDHFQNYANKKSVFVDVAFHVKNEGKENANPHCHVLCANRVIDKDGNLLNAFRNNNNPELKKLDTVWEVKKQLAEAFNEEIKKQAKYDVVYSYKSNEELKNEALENGDYETAIAKDYEATYEKKNKDGTTETVKNFDKKDYFDKKKKKWIEEQKEKTRSIKAEQKRKAEQYKKTLKEIELIEAEQFHYNKEIEKLYLLKADVLQKELLERDIKEFREKTDNNMKLLNILNESVDDYNYYIKENYRLIRDVTIDYFNEIPKNSDLKSLVQIKNFLTERAKENKHSQHLTDEELNYNINLLVYNISKKEEQFKKELPYKIYINNKEDREQRYIEILEKLRQQEEYTKKLNDMEYKQKTDQIVLDNQILAEKEQIKEIEAQLEAIEEETTDANLDLKEYLLTQQEDLIAALTKSEVKVKALQAEKEASKQTFKQASFDLQQKADFEKLTEEDIAFKQVFERKEEVKKSFDKDLFEYMHKKLDLTREEYKDYAGAIVRKKIEEMNKNENMAFDELEIKFMTENKLKFYTNEKYINKIFDKKENFLQKQAEFKKFADVIEHNKEIKKMKEEQIKELRQSKEANKAATDIAQEILENEDENIKEMYRIMNPNQVLNSIYKAKYEDLVNDLNSQYQTYTRPKL